MQMPLVAAASAAKDASARQEWLGRSRHKLGHTGRTWLHRLSGGCLVPLWVLPTVIRSHMQQ